MSDRELLRKIFAIMRNLLLIPYGDCGQIAPRKGTTRRECYRALYEIQELLGSRQLFPPKQTNADRIRAMTDEELAKFLLEFEYHETDLYCMHLETCKYGDPCADCLRDWLKKEVDDG